MSEGPSKVAKLREVFQHNLYLHGRGGGRGSPAGGRGRGRGRGTILIEPQTTVRLISTPSSSHIEVATPRGTLNLDPTPAEEEVAEAEYLRAQDYQSSRILPTSDLRVAGSVLFRIRKESDKWLKLPDKAIDPKHSISPLTASRKPLSLSFSTACAVPEQTRVCTLPASQANLTTCQPSTPTSGIHSPKEQPSTLFSAGVKQRASSSWALG